jgi:hypothetical protein
MNIIILFQIGNIDISLDILKKITHILSNFNTTLHISILSHLNSNLISDYLVSINFNKYIITEHINKGMDIGPFLLQLKNIINNNNFIFDIIIKLHTKTNQIWRNELIDPIINSEKQNDIFKLIDNNNKIIGCKKWCLFLDTCNKNNINLICNKLNIKNIFYDIINTDIKNVTYNDIDIDFYKNYYNVTLNTENNSLININKLILFNHMTKYNNIPSENFILQKNKVNNVSFIGGTIFIADFKTYFDFFSSIDIDEIYNLLEDEYVINDKSTYVHAMERLLTSFIYINNKKIISI